MIINGKSVSIDNILEDVNIDKNIPLKRENGLILRESQIEVLKKYNIDYKSHTNLSSLIFEIEEILSYETDLEDLETLSEELTEQNYYNNTNK